MQKRVLKALYNERKKIEEKEEEIKRFTSDPLMLFNELQYDQEIIPKLLKNISESHLIDYQKWQYPMVQRAIIDQFNISPFILSWDDDIFPSPIYLVRNGYRVAAINPYENTFEVLASENVKNILNEYKRISSRRIHKWEELQELNAKRMNPFINEDDSLYNTIKVSLRKKKKGNELERTIELYAYDLEALIEEENVLYRQLESMSREENVNNYEIEKIYNLLKPYLGLRLVDGYQNQFIEVEREINLVIKDTEDRIEELNKLVSETEQY